MMRVRWPRQLVHSYSHSHLYSSCSGRHCRRLGRRFSSVASSRSSSLASASDDDFSRDLDLPLHPPFAIRASIVHSTRDSNARGSFGCSDLEVLDDAIVVVDAHGIIAEVIKDAASGQSSSKHMPENIVTHNLGPSRLLLPGFVDAHAHAPQYEFVGNGFGLPLLQWLDTYTFPTEASYAIPHDDHEGTAAARVRAKYERVVAHSLKCGTTTCSYLNCIDGPSSLILADVAHKAGQRALVGKVSMDANAPDFYRETSADAAAADARTFVEAMLERYGQENSLVMPVVTPRFAPTCSSSLLAQLGALADEYQLRIQSHLSENVDECLWVLSELFPGAGSYAEVYETHGLLTPRTYLAHGVFSTKHERRVMEAAGASVVHCASSNANLMSGFADVRAWQDDGVTVSLGTDVAGGSSISMLTTARRTLENSNSISILRRQMAAQDVICRVEAERDEERRRSLASAWTSPDAPPTLSVADVLHMATRGGAKALNLDDVVGGFDVGMHFDAVCATFPDVPGGDVLTPICLRESDGTAQMLEKLLLCGDERNIEAVYVKGTRRI